MPKYHLTLTLRDQGRPRTMILEHAAATIEDLASLPGFVKGLEIQSNGRTYPVAVNMDHVVRIGPYAPRASDEGEQP
jgi:hypothetical protein